MDALRLALVDFVAAPKHFRDLYAALILSPPAELSITSFPTSLLSISESFSRMCVCVNIARVYCIYYHACYVPNEKTIKKKKWERFSANSVPTSTKRFLNNIVSHSTLLYIVARLTVFSFILVLRSFDSHCLFLPYHFSNIPIPSGFWSPSQLRKQCEWVCVCVHLFHDYFGKRRTRLDIDSTLLSNTFNAVVARSKLYAIFA